MSEQTADVVVVGGGVAGGALATVLARRGLEVVVLESQPAYRDRVRGECLAPWGVEELQRLGLHDVVLAAGGAHTTRVVRYDETVAPETAEAEAVALDRLLPGVPGALNVGHPATCEALTATAAAAGAVVVRGASTVRVAAGANPVVAYQHGGTRHRVRCRLVVGADGRGSAVRRQAGIALHQTPARTMGGGLLVEDLTDWPAHVNAIGTEGDVLFLVFPRPDGVTRLYLLWDVRQKGRFSGPNRRTEFLDAFRLRSLPHGEAVARAAPVGSCAAYPMNDSWCDQPLRDGLVLVGDAAGWNDPIIGQGLAIALRDVRLVADLLTGADDWSPAALRPYTAERAERMRRLRFSARLATEIRATFTPAGAARRRRISERAKEEPLLRAVLAAGLVGPERVPAEAFTAENYRRCLRGDEASGRDIDVGRLVAEEFERRVPPVVDLGQADLDAVCGTEDNPVARAASPPEQVGV